MKANKFIKKFGIDRAKQVLVASAGYDSFIASDISATVIYGLNDGYTPREDLKILVESHDYIESLGGYQFVKDNLPLGYFGDGDYKDLIQKCLEDVESCK